MTLLQAANAAISGTGPEDLPVTGCRRLSVVADPELSASIRKVHDFVTVGAPAPLQQAGVTALHLPDSYYAELAATYQQKC